MQTVDHVLFAVFPVVAYSLFRHRRISESAVIATVMFASLAPDIVDKPLAWTFGVIPSGRMVAHSLVVAVPVVVVVLAVSYRSGRLPLGVVFAWGYLSHLVGDFYTVLFRGSAYYYYPNLFWPLMTANPDRHSGFAYYAPELSVGLVAKLAVISIVIGYVVLDLNRRHWKQARPR